MVALAVELLELDFEIRAHVPHDRLHPGQVPVGEYPVPELRDENQVRVHRENAMATGAYLEISAHKPTV
ncbi:hypothetical protein GCM10027447_04980 [Glycomyces halotolerans]